MFQAGMHKQIAPVGAEESSCVTLYDIGTLFYIPWGIGFSFTDCISLGFRSQVIYRKQFSLSQELISSFYNNVIPI
jgi:hypothetical protein